MKKFKMRMYDKKHNVMEYIDYCYYFEENGIHELRDFREYEIPMFSTGKTDNDGAEL
ncbi:hypothetical protein [Paenibacillus naphthalenovorans]|uniref:YopX protein domain-containing protein n=1 Tax=Paenibacillus naphthalenovorans TaxID=162209 RepID=A0A0U2VEZ2_9BACL|nr:hypothetical protein [Paenibacillus naphthalenovorans]ALS22099.1 hypothetical protein IJ22_17250 [Paenibacillus naphthalenovorans]